ncbi:MAG: methyltransferase [Eubacteriales bacterium]|nr:methyltransferase [Eubacteriales bacterium]
MERMDDLQYEGLVLYQDTEYARFGADALKLCSFLRLKPEDRVVELGSGTGVICILGERKTGARFTGVERQARLVALSQKSAQQNGQAIRFLEADAAQAPDLLGRGIFTAAVMNPPYFTSGEPSPNHSLADARHDAARTLETFLSAAFQLLCNGGRLFLIYPADALTELLSELRAHRLEPKRMRFLYTKPGMAAKRVLVEAKKLGKPGLTVESPDWMQED